MSQPQPLDPGDKFFAAFIAVAITVAGLLGVVGIVVIEWAMLTAGLGNWLFWHVIFFVIAFISSWVYTWLIRKGNF